LRERWAAHFSELAAAHWTPERTAELTGGKTLALMPVESAVLLRALGLLHRDASMPPKQVRKYLQINHMLAVLGPSLRELSSSRESLRFIDAGCGRSYFTLLLAWHVKHNLQRRVRVTGIDRNAELIEECRRRAALAELDDIVDYVASPIESFEPESEIDGVVSLHACDTATDDALFLAVKTKATLIACAPCCQAELARGWTMLADAGGKGAFSSLWSTPHLRRESAATLTDAMRALLLRAYGYRVWPLEFVPVAHTPKNTLLRAMRRGERDPAALAEYAALVAATGGCGIALSERLHELLSK
jgi:SAM-dependent methyltransferase